MPCQGPMMSVPFSPCHGSVSFLYISICGNLFPIRNIPRLVHRLSQSSVAIGGVLLLSLCHSGSCLQNDHMLPCWLKMANRNDFLCARILGPAFEIKLLPSYGLQFRKLKFQLSESTGLHQYFT